jgi:hypothetical protein
MSFANSRTSEEVPSFVYADAKVITLPYGQKTQPRLNTPGSWCMSQDFVRDFDRDERRGGLRDLIGRLDIRETHLSRMVKKLSRGLTLLVCG